jgi:hypothetical protein
VDSRERISDYETAVLRSWLAGNHPKDIAKARRETEARILDVLSQLCDLNRGHGRQVLDTGLRQKPPAGPAMADRAAIAAERDKLRADLDATTAERDQLLAERDTARAALRAIGDQRDGLRRQLDELAGDARREADQRDADLADLHTRPRLPVPLAEYGAWRCAGCGWIGAGQHEHPVQPVTVAILPSGP